MNSAVATHVADTVARRTGVPVSAVLTAPDLIRLTPAGYSEQESFVVEIRTAWRNAEAVFIPGAFARPLIQRMSEASIESRIAFAALAAEATKQSRLTFRINGSDTVPADYEKWPKEWKTFDLTLRKHGLVFEELAPKDAAAILAGISAMLFAMAVTLIGVDAVDADDSAHEGASTEQISKRYERRAVNREICIALKGRRCWCCDMDFGTVYGPDADGFIEVHHKVPVSGMGPGYLVHPVRDLFPVCSNCHSVIHLAQPPLDPDALRLRIRPSTSV